MNVVCNKLAGSAADSRKMMGARPKLFDFAKLRNVVEEGVRCLKFGNAEGCANVVQRLNFSNSERKRRTDELDEMTQEHDSFSSKFEQLTLEVQCGQNIEDEATSRACYKT